jgi:murein DD-endopeptidase MepM/ murein hydrolase activator NlpD
VVLTAALGVTLVTGIAGGGAAAAHRHSAAALRSPALRSPAPRSPAPRSPAFAPGSPASAELGATTSEQGTDFTYPGDDPITSEWEPPGTYVTAGIASETVRLKERPRPVLLAAKPATGGAAWVNPNPAARTTSCFGFRWGRLHEGVDMAAPDGTPIVAAGAGVVVRAGVAEGYGNAVLIDHGDGFLTHYGHLSAITVTVGQHVAAGEQIGNEGSTGHSTGPHLHFEVHQGFYQNPIEPTAWMREHGVDIPGCRPS